jgi:predicted glycoside hydrolase/deacetylase ChbG (UPF0249 family)
MLIVNADDWGHTAQETDAALACLEMKRVTSIGAMVFMEDAERAAELAKSRKFDVGIHLNFCEAFSQPGLPEYLRLTQSRLVSFLGISKYALLIYNPFIREHIRFSYQVQMGEFSRLYGRPPSFTNGHKHNHLCTNMLFGEVIPHGQRVRRTFSFQPGTRGFLNRAYRIWVNKWLEKRYAVTDHFFSLRYSLEKECLPEIAQLARGSTVELMVHPGNPTEFEFMTGDEFSRIFDGIPLGSFAQI